MSVVINEVLYFLINKFDLLDKESFIYNVPEFYTLEDISGAVKLLKNDYEAVKDEICEKFTTQDTKKKDKLLCCISILKCLKTHGLMDKCPVYEWRPFPAIQRSKSPLNPILKYESVQILQVMRQQQIYRHSKKHRLMANSGQVSHVSRIIFSDISGHLHIFTIAEEKVSDVEVEVVDKLYFSRRNLEKVNNQMLALDWSAVFASADVNIAVNIFLKYVTSTISKFCLKTQVTKKKFKKPWFTNELLKLPKLKNNLHKEFLKNPTDFNKQFFIIKSRFANGRLTIILFCVAFFFANIPNLKSVINENKFNNNDSVAIFIQFSIAKTAMYIVKTICFFSNEAIDIASNQECFTF
ncbi:hypothetical protein HELRODRAFT_174301 [Helobdella robusta]|uniref:Uncharacterized protein n=1 Tax=Helobdella robusta TaxID=6412 RepID=T1F7Y9_HELRO|nr:hypothetical protein HELRODRAFT_174301 [Helobdella robusta]ESO02864.1 hypothetical protein HELRODRAFT_174301 [Helobdella robusta]